MNLENAYFISQILGTIAILISLVYVAMQIRQSNQISHEQTRHRMMELAQQQLLMRINNPEIAAAFIKEDISYEDKVKFGAWLTICMRTREYEWFSFNNGMIDAEMYKTYSGVIPIHLGTERSRKWWKIHRQENEFNPEFVKHIDNILKNAPLTDYFGAIDTL